MLKNRMRPVHPGEVLREDYLKRLNVPTSRMNDIVLERRGVSADTALRLTRCFGGDAQTWLNLQAIFDLRTVEIASAKFIKAEVEPIDLADFAQG